MWNPADDGVTHVNVYSRSPTQLGRLLSNFAHTPFVVPEHGQFASVEGYWYWLSCRDERLRYAYGFAAKKLGRERRGADWPALPDFQPRILAALRAKLHAIPLLQQLLAANTLPLAHYYVFGGSVRDEQRRCQWMLDFWTEAAEQLRASSLRS